MADLNNYINEIPVDLFLKYFYDSEKGKDHQSVMGIGRGDGTIVNDDSNRCYISNIDPNSESVLNVEVPDDFSIEKPTFSPYKRYCVLNNNKIYISYDNKIENISLLINQRVNDPEKDYDYQAYKNISAVIQKDKNGKYFFELFFTALYQNANTTKQIKPVFNLIKLTINSKKIYEYDFRMMTDENISVDDNYCKISISNNHYILKFYIDEIKYEAVTLTKNFSIKNIKELSYKNSSSSVVTIRDSLLPESSIDKDTIDVDYTYKIVPQPQNLKLTSLRQIELKETKSYTNSGIEIQDNIFLNKRKKSIIDAINKISDSRTNLNKMSLQTNGYIQIYNYCQGLIQELKNIQNSEIYETANTNLIQPKDVKIRTVKTEKNKDVIELTDYSKLVVSQFNSIFAHLIVDPAEWYFSAININDENSVYKKIYEAKLNKAINEGTTITKKDVSEIVYETIGSEP